MKHTKRLTSAILAIVMVLSMLIPAAVLPVTAEEAVDLSKHLYVHYDFEGADWVEMTKDKALTKAEGGISVVNDNLSMSGSTIGTADAPGTEWKIQTNFEFIDGTVSPLDRRAALRAAPSEDLTAIQAEKSASTWFARFKMDGFESESASVSQAAVVYFGTYSGQNAVPEGGIWAKPFVSTVDRNNLQTQYHGTRSSLKSMWEPGEWMNVSMVRTYNEASNDYSYVYTVYNDDLQVLTQQTVSAGLDTYGKEELFLFRFGNQNSMKGTENWLGDTGLTLDDVRCYDLALTQDQIKNIITEEFSLENSLLFHYDFEGTGDEVYADKATGKASTVKDDLVVWNPQNATVANGVITSNSNSFAMKTPNSADVRAIQANPQTTWFFRFKAVSVSSAALVDFRDGAGTYRPMYLELTNGKIITVYYNAKGNTQPDATTGVLWNANEWINLAVVRNCSIVNNAKTYTMEMYYIADDGALTRVFAPHELTGINGDGGIDIHYFCHYNEKDNAYNNNWSKGATLSYDDIRCYNTALTPKQLSEMVVEEFGANVVNKGLQVGVGTDNNTNQVRLIAQIRGTDYKAAGFKVTATWDGQTGTAEEVDLASTVAYTSVQMEQSVLYNGNKMTWGGNYYPNEGYYLIAVIVDNIPNTLTNVKLTFTPYAISKTGTTEYTGDSFTYNVTTGAYVQ